MKNICKLQKMRVTNILLVFICGENENERSEFVTISFVEFVLKLNPVETQRVKERTKRLHHQQHSHGREYEDDDPNDQDQHIVVTVLLLVILPTRHKKIEMLDRRERSFITPKLEGGPSHRRLMIALSGQG